MKKLLAKSTLIGCMATVLFGAVGCASGGKKKDINLDELTNKDFKKPAAERYNENKDYFSSVEIEGDSALEDETLYRLQNSDGKVESSDAITKIVKACYEGEFDQAFDIVSAEHDRYKENPAFWNQVGTCYLLQGKKRKALLFYNKSLEFKPGYSPALNNIGVMYRKDGQDQKAEVAFNRAIEKSNFAKTPRFNLAQLYLDYGLFNNAIAQLRVLERADKDSDVFASLGSAYLMAGDYRKASSYFNKLPSNYLEKPYVGINAALAFYQSGNQEKARDILDDIDKDRLGPFKKYYQESAKKVGL